VQSFAADHPHKLLERFTEALADVLRGEFGAPWARVSVAKLAPIAGVARIGVAIERGKRS
jgi:dihydroneopterin aldolase